jgi:hypothetical protein
MPKGWRSSAPAPGPSVIGKVPMIAAMVVITMGRKRRKHTPERCLEAAFCFSLDREPKESILGHFDVTVSSRYFPQSDR